jgi:hypothetical protein
MIYFIKKFVVMGIEALSNEKAYAPWSAAHPNEITHFHLEPPLFFEKSKRFHIRHPTALLYIGENDLRQRPLSQFPGA